MSHGILNKTASRLAIALTLGFLSMPASAQYAATGLKTAIFAGGCFWSMEKAFEHQDGVAKVVSGFTGGTVENPSYQQVSTGTTGHREAVRVEYDPTKITYDKLLDIYWHSIDPTDPNGQFCDKGYEYTSAIFTADASETKLAQVSKTGVAQALGAEVATEILPAASFYPAEAFHQDYAENNPLKYQLYRTGCGRDAALKKVWSVASQGGRAMP